MSELKERLDNIRNLIQEKDFLEGKGLSNEVNIRIFCYNPKDEMLVKHFVDQLMNDKTLPCHLKEFNLYDVFLSICEDKGILHSISSMEIKRGKDFLRNQLARIINNTAYVAKMKSQISEDTDVILLTGIGDVFPFIRVHDILNAIQPEFPDIPILVFYPGTYDGRDVRLFNLLKKNSYYRAFNVI